MVETDIAQVRFGYGFGPRAAPITRARLLEQALRQDEAAARFPGVSLSDALIMGQAVRSANKARRQGKQGANQKLKTARNALRQAGDDGLRTSLARVVDANSPLRERLTWFWADHFTVAARNPFSRAAALSFVDDAVRPHVLGRFSDMLKAVVRHPAMLVYLDQHQSIGPDSPVGKRTGRGLNENLARELLELHTMGVGSGYTQNDVRSAAELLTGLSFNQKQGFSFRPRAAQPGAETVLGKAYGSSQLAKVSDIDAFLEDLALRPETGQHLARKMTSHFLGNDASEPLVQDLALTYQQNDGDLGAVVRAFAEHPDSASSQLSKVKTPFEFIASTLIALGMRGDDVMRLKQGNLRKLVTRPLAAMGQPFMRPNGPDGWSEDPEHWISPQGLATRISWAVAVADKMGQRVGDPRQFLDKTLRGLSGPSLRFAVSAAETQAEGIALVLASAEFNRR